MRNRCNALQQVADRFVAVGQHMISHTYVANVSARGLHKGSSEAMTMTTQRLDNVIQNQKKLSVMVFVTTLLIGLGMAATSTILF
jgi:hypothetical protein